MTAVRPERISPYPGPVRRTPRGSALARMLRTTDAKQIGMMYLVTSFGFFFAGGLMALLMRAELARPGLQFLSPEQYNQLFTMHGTIMLLLFATPIVFAFANYVVPLQIGAPDVSFPRLNAFAYWLYLFGGLMAVGGFATPGGAADFGWFAYQPLASAQHSPGVGGDLWYVGLVLSGLGTILGAVNMITTILTLRAPGMTMFRMPIFTWNILITALMVVIVFPLLAATLLAAMADRMLGAHVFDPATGGPMLWQHLFWLFGHPEVYIVAIPFFGIVTEIIPVLSRKPVFGYRALVFATVGIASLFMTVWAHHMFATGQVRLPFFSLLSYFIAVPTGVKFFNWIGTMWKGHIKLRNTDAVRHRLPGHLPVRRSVRLASPPVDWHVTDSYFVVAHFHYVLFGTIAFAVFGGVYFWFSKMTGRLMDERLGKVHLWLTFSTPSRPWARSSSARRCCRSCGMYGSPTASVRK
jgi:cytochrome c oxidase subunit I